MHRRTLPRRHRSKRQVLAPVLLCIICGLVAAVIGFRPQQSQTSADSSIRVARDFDTILVPVPHRDVVKGQRVGETKFITIKWPKSYLVGDYLREADAYQDHLAKTLLPAFMPVPLSSLSKTRTPGNSVTERIPEGMRAVTVTLNSESAVEGWVQSGSHVDVVVLRRKAGRAGEIQSRVIAENVQVLSAGRSSEPVAQGPTVLRVPDTITLLVSQDDALRISAASEVGRVTLTLRGIGDQQPTYVRRMNQREILGLPTMRIREPKRYRGTARGPDGKHYVLTENEHWEEKSIGELYASSQG